jgi:hypothetical protein
VEGNVPGITESTMGICVKRLRKTIIISVRISGIYSTRIKPTKRKDRYK